MLRNRRKSKRIAVKETPCLIRFNSVEAQGLLVDTSSGGAKIGGVRVSLMFANQKILVQTPDECFTGSCRTVARDSTGLFQVGVLKVPSDHEEASDTILINSFVKLNNRKTICLPLAVDQQRIRIQLLNGQLMTVDESQVVQLTREERLEELCADVVLKDAMAGYGQASTGNDFVDRTNVLNHEFGPPNMPCVVAE